MINFLKDLFYNFVSENVGFLETAKRFMYVGKSLFLFLLTVGLLIANTVYVEHVLTGVASFDFLKLFVLLLLFFLSMIAFVRTVKS